MQKLIQVKWDTNCVGDQRNKELFTIERNIQKNTIKCRKISILNMIDNSQFHL